MIDKVDEMELCLDSILENTDNPIVVFVACDALGALSTQMIVVTTLRCLLWGTTAVLGAINAIVDVGVLEYLLYLMVIFVTYMGFLSLLV